MLYAGADRLPTNHGMKLSTRPPVDSQVVDEDVTYRP
jgi:hypothetical protein